MTPQMLRTFVTDRLFKGAKQKISRLTRRQSTFVPALSLEEYRPHPEELAKQASRRMDTTHGLAAILRDARKAALLRMSRRYISQPRSLGRRKSLTLRLQCAGKMPLQHRARDRVGLLQIDAPVFQLVERYPRIGHRAAHVGARRGHAEIAIQILHLRFAMARGPEIYSARLNSPTSPPVARARLNVS